MRSASLLFALLFAVVFTACSTEPEEEPREEEEKIDCGGGITVLKLRGPAASAVLSGMTGEDTFDGICAPEESVGNDVLIHFRATEAGFYRFSTEGTEFDTVMYALSDCKNDFSQFACNDDFGEKKHSQLLLRLEAEQEVFIVVDGVNVRQPQPFTLTASLVEASPPIIETIQGYANGSVGTTGVTLTGKNPDSLVIGVVMQLYGQDGKPLLPNEYTANFKDVEIFQLKQENGNFRVNGSFRYLDGTVPVTRILIKLVDENGLISEAAFSTMAPPVPTDRGEPCDPMHARTLCGPDDACFTRAPATEPHCVIASPPTLLSAQASLNLETGYWGVVVEGTDLESDAARVRLLPRTSSGAEVSIGLSGAVDVLFHQIGHDEGGAFRGVAALRAQFDGPCYPAAEADFLDCMRRTNNQAACNDAAIALLEACYVERLPTIAKVDVEVVDVTGKVSARMTVDIETAPAVEEGGACDPYGAIGACPEDFVCWADASIEPETCREEGPSCPSDYGVIELLPSGTSWSHRGNNAASEAHGIASCGGSGPSDVLGFKAPAAGTYVATTSNLGMGVNTVLSVRPFCQLSGYDLACNDNVNNTDPSSRVEVVLEEGETVYFVVHGVQGAVGDYTLTVSRK